MIQLRPLPPENLIFADRTNQSDTLDAYSGYVCSIVESTVQSYSQIIPCKNYVLENRNKVTALKPIVSKSTVEALIAIISKSADTPLNLDVQTPSTVHYERTLDTLSALPKEDIDTITSVVEARTAFFKQLRIQNPSLNNCNSVRNALGAHAEFQVVNQVVPVINALVRTALWLHVEYPGLPSHILAAVTKLVSCFHSPVETQLTTNNDEERWVVFLPLVTLYASLLCAGNSSVTYGPYNTTLRVNSLLNSVLSKASCVPSQELLYESSIALSSYIRKRNQYFEAEKQQSANVITPFKNMVLQPTRIEAGGPTSALTHQVIPVDTKYKHVLPGTICTMQISDIVSEPYDVPYYVCMDDMLNLKFLFPFMQTTMHKLCSAYGLQKRNPLAPYSKDSDILTNPTSTGFPDVVKTLFLSYTEVILHDGEDDELYLTLDNVIYTGLEDITKYLLGTTTEETKDDNLFHSFQVKLIPNGETLSNLYNAQKLGDTNP